MVIFHSQDEREPDKPILRSQVTFNVKSIAAIRKINRKSNMGNTKMESKNLIKIMALTVLIASAGSAMANPSATLQVKGTITPAACTPTLSNGGIVDFGTVSSSTLSATGVTSLGGKVTTLSVTCTAAAKVAFTILDNRASSATPSGYGEEGVYGLGMAGDLKIGNYVIYPSNAIIDGKTGDILSGNAARTTWTKMLPGSNNINNSVYDNIVSVGTSGTLTPVAFENMSMDLTVYPDISKEMSGITEVQQIDGNATLNFEYL